MSKVGPGGGGVGASEDPLLVFSASMETVPRAQRPGGIWSHLQAHCSQRLTVVTHSQLRSSSYQFRKRKKTSDECWGHLSSRTLLADNCLDTCISF